jgi:hypothetical protein
MMNTSCGRGGCLPTRHARAQRFRGPGLCATLTMEPRHWGLLVSPPLQRRVGLPSMLAHERQLAPIAAVRNSVPADASAEMVA